LKSPLGNARQLREFCRHLEQAEYIAFDTEFVGENHFRPLLCLVQVATAERTEMIDALAIQDLQPFWDVLVQGDHVTLLHAGQHELRYCLTATDCRPANLFDVQIAAGLIGWEYPTSYSNLVQRATGVTITNQQTRTDWRRRPLNAEQLAYALSDVEHLHGCYQVIHEKLVALDRVGWMEEEMERLEQTVREMESLDRWRRLSGIHSMKPKQLAIVRAIWLWRNEAAAATDRPPKQILRDDLIVEIAKLNAVSENRILTIRNMTQPRFRKHVKQIAEAVAAAKSLSNEQLPERIQRDIRQESGLTGQFLSVVLACICRQHAIAPGIVGANKDIHALLAWYQNHRSGNRPLLASGWREQVVGSQIASAFEGKLAVAIEAREGEKIPVVSRTATHRS